MKTSIAKNPRSTFNINKTNKKSWIFRKFQFFRKLYDVFLQKINFNPNFFDYINYSSHQEPLRQYKLFISCYSHIFRGYKKKKHEFYQNFSFYQSYTFFSIKKINFFQLYKLLTSRGTFTSVQTFYLLLLVYINAQVSLPSRFPTAVSNSTCFAVSSLVLVDAAWTRNLSPFRSQHLPSQRRFYFSLDKNKQTKNMTIKSFSAVFYLSLPIYSSIFLFILLLLFPLLRTELNGNSKCWIELCLLWNEIHRNPPSPQFLPYFSPSIFHLFFAFKKIH